jgi:hypothetical protein
MMMDIRTIHNAALCPPHFFTVDGKGGPISDGVPNRRFVSRDGVLE